MKQKLDRWVIQKSENEKLFANNSGDYGFLEEAYLFETERAADLAICEIGEIVKQVVLTIELVD